MTVRPVPSASMRMPSFSSSVTVAKPMLSPSRRPLPRTSSTRSPSLMPAIGPVMAWVIPIFLAYIPGLVIGFMISTLLITRYQELPLVPPRGDWPEGEWPSVTILVAAWNESEAIVRTLEHVAELAYAGRLEVVIADNNSTDDTARLADAAGARLGLHYRRVFEEKQGKHHALNSALATVMTPLVVTVDADTHLQLQSVTRLVVRLTTAPQGQHVCALRRSTCRGEPAGDLRHPDAAMGLPARDQRRQTDAGGVQHRARRAGSVLGLLDERPAGRRRMARCDR